MKQLVFIHVRKNAGTSIIQWFEDIGYPLHIVYDYNQLPDPIPDNWVIFAVTRNPYDRCVSSWKYCASTKNRSLLDCLANPPPDGVDEKYSPQVTPGHDYRHFTRTQLSFLYPHWMIDRLLRFTNLEEELWELCEIHEIETYGRKLPHLNKGSYDVTLSQEEKDAIYEFYKEDFNNLGYKR